MSAAAADVTVLCLWVRGHVNYTADYVVRLASMTKRLASRPIRFICVTDSPFKLPAAIERIVIRPWIGPFAWWNKVRLFDPCLGFTEQELPLGQTVEEPLQGRVLYFDLDTLLVRDPIEFADYPAAFALAPPGGNFKPPMHQVVKRYNSSVMTWNAGEQSEIFTQYTNDLTARYWGDQDWIGVVKPDAAVMPTSWFPRLSELSHDLDPACASPPAWPRDARVILCKKPKNLDALSRFAWFDEAWR